jgi:hypothetical protein
MGTFFSRNFTTSPVEEPRSSPGPRRSVGFTAMTSKPGPLRSSAAFSASSLER